MNEPKPEQKKLSAADLELIRSISGTSYKDPQIEMIWRKKIPVGTSVDDFSLFLYRCHIKALDPLLGEVYARLQWDSEAGESRLILIDSIHGLLKLADSTKELDGLETTVEETEAGIVSATTTIYRKGCAHPFRATAYFYEYAARKREGGLVSMWATKGRFMISKCSQAICLRLAFAAALAGVYVPEELERVEAAPEENLDFPVGELDAPLVTNIPTPDPAATEEELVENGSSMTNHDDKNSKPTAKALAQRIFEDLGAPKGAPRRSLAFDFYRGFLGDTYTPSTDVTAALGALDAYALTNPMEARMGFLTDPMELGKFLKGRNNA